MCPVADNNDGPLAFEAIVERARVPTIKLVANGLRARVRHRAEGVVDQHHVRSASVESAANADRVIAAALRRVPTSARLRSSASCTSNTCAYSSDFMRLRTSRPKSSASAKLADAEMKCWSGCRPRYQAGKRLDAWRCQLRRENLQSRYVFNTERGGPVTRAWFLKMVRRTGELAKLPFPIHPHMLRHGCGFKLANDGVDTRALQHFLGHRNIMHTVRYTELRSDRF